MRQKIIHSLKNSAQTQWQFSTSIEISLPTKIIVYLLYIFLFTLKFLRIQYFHRYIDIPLLFFSSHTEIPNHCISLNT